MANEVKAAFDIAFRDFTTEGVPSSGANKVKKAEVRLAGKTVQDQVDSPSGRVTSVEGNTAAIPQIAEDVSEALGVANTALSTAQAGIKPDSPVVRLLTTTNVNISNALKNGDTLDGKTLVTGDRVALVGQTDPAQNGVYVVQASGAAVRAADFDTSDEILRSRFTVAEGTHTREAWTVQNTDAITVGTTAIVIKITTPSDPANAEILARIAPISATSKDKVTIRDEDGFIGFEYDPGRGVGLPGGAWFKNSGDGTEVDRLKLAGAVFKKTDRAILRVLDEEGFILIQIGEHGFSYEGQEVAPTPATAVRIVSGALTDTSFDVVADVEGNGAGIAKLIVSTDEHFTNRVFVSPVSAPDITDRSEIDEWRSVYFSATGLAADTAYWYCVSLDGRFDPSAVGTIRTHPARGVSASFKFVFGSCSNILSPATAMPALDAIRAEVAAGARFLLHLGDITYSDIITDDIYKARALNARRYRGNSAADLLNSVCPLIYIPSDHDTANNDCSNDSTYVGTTFAEIASNTRKAYRETVPHYPFVQQALGETDPDKILLTQSFDVAKTRFLMLDCYSQSIFATGTPTVLGNSTNPLDAWNQLDWLLGAIDQAESDGLDHLFIAIGRGWTPAIEASWEQTAPDERQAIVDHVNGLSIKVTIVGADFHFCGVDDGTNAGIPLAIASPFRQDTIGNPGGTQTGFSWDGANGAIDGNTDAYALMEVAENGDWTVTFKGAPYTDGVPTVLGTYSYADIA